MISYGLHNREAEIMKSCDALQNFSTIFISLNYKRTLSRYENQFKLSCQFNTIFTLFQIINIAHVPQTEASTRIARQHD